MATVSCRKDYGSEVKPCKLRTPRNKEFRVKLTLVSKGQQMTLRALYVELNSDAEPTTMTLFSLPKPSWIMASKNKLCLVSQATGD